MARNRKRTKQVQEMVDYVNSVMKEQMVNDTNKYDCHLFNSLTHLLLKTNLYKGYNEFYERELSDGMKLLTLVGTENIPTEKRFIQLY